ncbi:MAG: hypothetical protein M1829_000771 [Trizodia sp. TS-e1964]|nr:MAG: hypothetical protein M1829_000771 [Trizodia sp. TS-e1964]
MAIANSYNFDDIIVTSNDYDDILSDAGSLDTSSLGSEYGSDAEREWQESIQQLELLLTMVLIPYLGKYFGRKCAYWGWAKWMEWRYPVEVTITSKAEFRATGMIGAAASL